MKILIVIYSLGYGGAEKQAVVDANALHQRGYEVTVAFHKDGDLSKLLDKHIAIYKIHCKNIVIASLQMFFHFIFHRYHIIHAHMFWAEKAAGLSGKLTRHKVIFNEHGLGLWRKWYHRFIMRTISMAAYKIINSCDATRNNRLTLERIKPGKLLTVYNSFDIPVQPVGNKKNNPFTIGFIGRFDPVKRLEFYIPLAKLLRDTIPGVKFVLVGDGPERGELEKSIKQNNLESHFTLTGYVLEPRNYLKDFDVFFMPSRREAFSVALLEAGALGVPSIAFKVGGNPEIIKDGVTGFIIGNHDIEAVAAKVIYLYQNPGEIIKFGQNAHQFVTGMFSVEKRIECLEKVYNRS